MKRLQRHQHHVGLLEQQLQIAVAGVGMAVDDHPVCAGRQPVLERLGLIHAGAAVRFHQVHVRQLCVTLFRPVGTGSLRIVVHQRDDVAGAGVGNGEVGGDGGLAASAFAIDDEYAARLWIHVMQPLVLKSARTG